ncbi:MAG TPA: tetratricopeptide repeat protein, partial [Candidatus Synoicihabitans sp.]|nr:tetratricopeptide repeat protein [Candidatus Synoicihabitans sp.]
MRALAAAIVRFVAWFRLTGLNHERTTRRERAPARRDLSAAFRTAALVAASASFFVTSRADGLAPLTAAQSQALEAAFVELPPVVPAAPPADAAAATEAEYASMVRVGENRLSAGDFETAILAFHRAARESLRAETRTAALAGLARTYRLSGDLVKAVATYERLIADHGDSPETPRHLLELGRTLRATGAPKLAIARFYGVLHTVLKVPTGQTEAYRQL